MMTTKAEVLNYIKSVTDTFDFKNSRVASAMVVSQTLSISRSLASQYLNELYRDSLLIKVNARPVLFLDKEVLKYTYGVPLKKDEYLGIHELQKELQNNQKHIGLYEMIGSNSSLKHVVEQLYASVTYPSQGLPLLLIGNRGVGKESLVKAVHVDSVKRQIIPKEKMYYHIDMSVSSSLKDEYNQYKDILGLLYISHVDRLAETDLDFLLNLLKERPHHIILSSENRDRVKERLFSEVPLHAHVSDLSDRYKEERIEFVIKFLKEESFNIKQCMRISMSTIHYIADLEFENQLEDLQKFVKMVCAKALSDLNNFETVNIYMYHLKNLVEIPLKDDLEMDEMLLVSDLSLEDDHLIEYYKRIMLHMNDYVQPLGLYIDYLLNKMSYDKEHVDDLIKSIDELFNKHSLLQEETFLFDNIEFIALTIYSFKRNYLNIHQWETTHSQLLSNIKLNVNNRHPDVGKKISQLTLSLNNYLGIRLNIINEIILMLLYIERHDEMLLKANRKL